MELAKNKFRFVCDSLNPSKEMKEIKMDVVYVFAVTRKYVHRNVYANPIKTNRCTILIGSQCGTTSINYDTTIIFIY